jgi:peptide/nickel transport system substrate-binding protein
MRLKSFLFLNFEILRNTKFKSLLTNSIFIFLIFIFQQCNFTESLPEGTIRVAIPSDVSSLDPLIGVDLVSSRVNRLIFRNLFTQINERVVPDLAESFSFPMPGVLHIRLRNITDTKGIPIQSSDVLYCLRRLIKEDNPKKSFYEPIHSIEELNEKDLVILFSGKKYKLLELLSQTGTSIYSEKAHKESGSFVSYGDYTLKEWKRGDYLFLSSNKNGPEQPPHIHLRVLTNSATALFLFIRKRLDIFKVPYFLMENPFSRGNKVASVKGKSIQYATIFWEDPCFDSNFRLALNYAIDRKSIIDKIFHTQADELYLAFPPEYTSDKLKNPNYKFSYNPEKAKEYLSKSSCYPKILERELDLRMRADDENKAKGLALRQYLVEIGLKVKINPMEKSSLYKENDEKKGDITLLTWYLDYDSTLNFIDPLFASDSKGNAGNRAFYENEEINEIIKKSRIEGELEEGDQQRVMEILFKENPWIYLWTIHENYMVSERAFKYEYSENLLF